jgi:protein KRI1
MAELHENDDGVEDEKPHWEEDFDIDHLIPDKELQKNPKKKKKKKKNDENEGAEAAVDIDAMDADMAIQTDDEEWDGTEEMRKRKLDEYMDEIYGLDFNDMVRFSGAWEL